MQLEFTPADVQHCKLRTMSKFVRRAMLPDCELYKISLHEGEYGHFDLLHPI